MRRGDLLFFVLVACVVAVVTGCRAGDTRVSTATANTDTSLSKLASTAELPHPIPRIYLRAFKAERTLEMWGASQSGSYRLVKSFPIARMSGRPGPKRIENDGQVPEGCYQIAVFNPESAFHLSLGLNYPNESDRIRADQTQPGSEIYIHGSNVSIGCLAMTDPIIEQIYLMAENAKRAGQKDIRVDIFPAKPGSDAWKELFAKHPEHAAFWLEIEPAYSKFESTHQPAQFTVGTQGEYRFSTSVH